MAAVSNCVVHMTMRFNDTVLAIGTGFIYRYKSGLYVVTAWHNLTGRHPDTLEFASKNGGVPNNILVRLPVDALGSITRLPVVIPLEGEDSALFMVHPKGWPRIDVAVIPLELKGRVRTEFDFPDGTKKEVLLSLEELAGGQSQSVVSAVQDYFVPDNEVVKAWFETVEVTEELFIPGYPQNVHDIYTQPVWKRATVASSVQQGWNRLPKFLVDSASKSGMSGSPVLYYSPKGKVVLKGLEHKFDSEVAILAGVYVGREGVTSSADPQIGIVWHASVIQEIIEGGVFESLAFEIEASPSEVEAAVLKKLAECSAGGVANILNEETHSRFFARNKILESLRGRGRPDSVLKELIRLAEIYDGPLVDD